MSGQLILSSTECVSNFHVATARLTLVKHREHLFVITPFNRLYLRDVLFAAVIKAIFSTSSVLDQAARIRMCWIFDNGLAYYTRICRIVTVQWDRR